MKLDIFPARAVYIYGITITYCKVNLPGSFQFGLNYLREFKVLKNKMEDGRVGGLDSLDSPKLKTHLVHWDRRVMLP